MPSSFGPRKAEPCQQVDAGREAAGVSQHIPGCITEPEDHRIPPGWVPWGAHAQVAPPHPFFLPAPSDHHGKLRPHLC